MDLPARLWRLEVFHAASSRGRSFSFFFSFEGNLVFFSCFSKTNYGLLKGHPWLMFVEYLPSLAGHALEINGIRHSGGISFQWLAEKLVRRACLPFLFFSGDSYWAVGVFVWDGFGRGCRCRLFQGVSGCGAENICYAL